MACSIRIALAQHQTFELLCGDQSRRAAAMEIESLAAEAGREYFGDGQPDDGNWSPKLPQLTALGRRLYEWLDGPEAWLRTGLAKAETVLQLDLSAPAEAQDLNPETESLLRKLAHLPWELLHNGKAFLAETGIQPVRVMQSRPADGHVANRTLRLLFMATSPENALPVLAYEREEAAILDATRQQPIDLVVEESGSVSQLQNLVASFEGDYFDIFHVTGHATIEDGTPRFLTEDEQGGERHTTAGEFAEAFGGRWPRLLFLSGCHTAQAPSRGAIPSMAHALVNAGADAVLGWARPVSDATGIFAATHLYRALATGETLIRAVAAVRREMLREFLRDANRAQHGDWHLLRLYQSVRETSALVTPLKTIGREQFRRKPPEPDFLDAEGKVRVAPADAFYGRRREMQRCLRALAWPGDYYGVFLHGIGGYGKSTIAARLCRRHEAQNPGFERVVLVGPVDEDRLRRRLSDKFGAMPEVIEILNQPKVPFKHQILLLFQTIERQGRNLLLVLDDFEQNIPVANVEDGSLRLAAGAWQALEALCFALEESGTASRLIVTCRYHSAAALPPNRLYVEGLSGMHEADIGKKVDALASRMPGAKRNRQREAKIVEASGGNPRLLEWLMALAHETDLIEETFLERMAAKESQFRESILAEKLLAALDEPQRKALARMTLFELPVPMAVVEEMAQGASLEKATNLGLLEKQIARGEDLYRVTTVLEPLLRPALNEGDWSKAQRLAAQKLHQVWWEIPDKIVEAHGLEVVRLAAAAGERELAVVPADGIATEWINTGRFLEALKVCRMALAVFDDYRTLGTIARAEQALGDIDASRSHYRKALAACRASDEETKATNLHNLAGLEAQEGDTERAMELWQEALDIYKRTGDDQGKAGTLQEIANQVAKQGDVEVGLQLWQQVLEIGSEQQKAVTLNNMASAIAQHGDLERALQLWQQALHTIERIGDVKGLGATLSNMAWAANLSGDHARSDRLNRQAAKVLSSVHAYHNLLGALNNLAATAQEDKEVFAAQAAWLVLKVKLPVGDSVGSLVRLFHLIPQGDPLERLLGAAAVIVAATRGKTHPEQKKLGEKAAELMSIAAVNAGVKDAESVRPWMAENQLLDPAYVFPRLLTVLEEFIANRWIFDPTPLKNDPDGQSGT